MKSARQLFDEARAKIKQVTAAEVRDRVAAGEPITLIDVREANEWNIGHLPNAIHIARGVLESNIDNRVPRDATVVLYCASGNRSALAALSLEEMGYSNVASMAGGFKDWVAIGGDIAD